MIGAVLFASAAAALIFGLSSSGTSPSASPAKRPPTTTATPAIVAPTSTAVTTAALQKVDAESAERSLRAALSEEQRYASSPQGLGAYATGGQMRQLAGSTIHFVDHEVPPGGDAIAVVVGGNPNDHSDDTVYLGARVAQSNTCIYVRDVVARASASFTVGTVWAVGSPCALPDSITDWRNVASPLELLGFGSVSAATTLPINAAPATAFFVQMDGVLAQSAAIRDEVASLSSDLSACRISPSLGRSRSLAITQERQELVNGLAGIAAPVGVTNALRLVSLLRTAEQQSITSHTSWRAWMSAGYATDFSDGCTSSQVTGDVTAAFNSAGRDKDLFTGEYNPAAAPYDVRSDWASTDF